MNVVNPASSGSETERSVTVLGCTGSVGTQTIELLMAEPDRYRVRALVALPQAVSGRVLQQRTMARARHDRRLERSRPRADDSGRPRRAIHATRRHGANWWL